MQYLLWTFFFYAFSMTFPTYLNDESYSAYLSSNQGTRKRSQFSELSTGPITNFSKYPFVALIIGGGVNNTILQVCSGSILNTRSSNIANHNTSFILTTSYCILNRQDPGDTSKEILYTILIENPNGNISLASRNFTIFPPLLRVLHPLAGTIQNFTVNITIPPGPTSQMLPISVNVHDIGIIQLESLIDLPSVIPIPISSQSSFQVGEPITLLGYGAPDFLHLHMTTRTVIVNSRNVSNNQPPDDLIFFHDSLADSPSTTATSPLQSCEIGDEGGPILNSNGMLVALGQATWRVSPNNNTILTYASLGPIVAYYQNYIAGVLSSLLPNANSTLAPGNPTQLSPPSAKIQSSSAAIFLNPILFFWLFLNLFAM